MESIFWIVAIKACSALVLALGVALASRRIRQPAVLHALWIVVLLELLVPPVLEVGVLPRSESVTVSEASQPTHEREAAAGMPADIPPFVADVLPPPAGPPGHVLRGALIGGWVAGAIGVLLLAGIRTVRFRSLLGDATDASEEIRSAVGALARRMGLTRCPPIRLVPARISPMLRCRVGPPELLFPTALLERLRRTERDALLAHELAHVLRKDHWVRYLELIAGSLFWWHPVVWWARSRLRYAEELCCDGLVVRTLPGRRGDYAKGLVKTVEFLAGSGSRLPALASGLGRGRHLKERLTMIIKQRSPRALSPTQKFALALAALGLLLVFPTWAERDPQDLTGPREAQAFEREQARVREDMLELEQRAMLLEQQLREVRVQQMELEHELHRQRQEFEIRRVQEKVARSEAAGLREEAVYLGERQEELREQLELESRRADLEREVMRRALEFKRIEMEQLEAEGDPARVAELEARAARVQAELQEAHRTAREHQERLEQAMTGLAMDRLREEIHRLREAGELQQAKEVERELAHLRMSRIERMKALDAQRTLQLEIEDLQARAARLRADGLMDEAQEIERHIEALLTELGRLDGE